METAGGHGLCGLQIPYAGAKGRSHLHIAMLRLVLPEDAHSFSLPTLWSPPTTVSTNTSFPQIITKGANFLFTVRIIRSPSCR